MTRGLAFAMTAALAFGVVRPPLRAQQTTTSTASAASTRSVWDGVYTLNQAKRGALKSGLCTSCHGDSFEGDRGPDLAGDGFKMRWEGRTIGDLFDLIRKTMPDD